MTLAWPVYYNCAAVASAAPTIGRLGLVAVINFPHFETEFRGTGAKKESAEFVLLVQIVIRQTAWCAAGCAYGASNDMHDIP